MTSPAAEKTVKDAESGTAAPDATAKARHFLRAYRGLPEPFPADTLADRYRIDLGHPLPELDSGGARAYAASDATEPGKSLYAHICAWGRPPRWQAIEALEHQPVRGLVAPLAAGTVILSATGHERCVIVYERPQGVSLSTLLERKAQPADPSSICERVLLPLATAIHRLGELGLSHGLVHPGAIFLGDTATLGPCVAEPCGYGQAFAYESVERLQSLPAARGDGSTAQDFYALAVVLLQILHGSGHLADYTEEGLIRAVLKEGAYQALMRDKDVPEVFYDFLRGMLAPAPLERWSGKQALAWLGGKRFNLLPPPVTAEAIRPLEFGETEACTRRELAHLASLDWPLTTTLLQGNAITQWVAVSLRDKDLSETIARLGRVVCDPLIKNETQISEALMEIALLLDPAGPIRFKQLALHLDGVGTLCAELHARRALRDLQTLSRFIESGAVKYWLELQSKLRRKEEYAPPPAVADAVAALARVRGFIRQSGFGFGSERILYELNPDMACVSPLLEEASVTTLGGMLTHLDRLAPSLAAQEEPLDRHIGAFLASKLGVTREIYLQELASIPALAGHRAMVALYLLALAQERAKTPPLPGLTHWLALFILPLLDHMRSRRLRQQYAAALMELAPCGSAVKIAELLISSGYADSDRRDFEQARGLFRRNAAAIAYYEASDTIERKSVRMGFHIAKALACLGLLFAIFAITQGQL